MSGQEVSGRVWRPQYGALLLLCLGGVGAAGVLRQVGSLAFQPYFGSVDPVLATTLAVLLGIVSLTYLDSRRWFAILSKSKGRDGFLQPSLWATLFVIPVIIVHACGGFPQDLNVTAPQSLLFYPLMALVAEMVFHAMPLCMLLIFLGPVNRRTGLERTGWFYIVLVSLIEPLFQVLRASGVSPPWVNAYVGLRVFAFNVLALYLFKRHDFLSVYFFRATY